jgi:secondary thiamine-phosphate synthase enzyme
MIKELSVNTGKNCELVEVTSRIQEVVSESGVKTGICKLFVPHTTAGILINENADPSVKADIIAALSRIVPEDAGYSHAEGNSPGHVKASLTGHSLEVFVVSGRLKLGTWQGIYFGEFDGPRSRKLWVSIDPGK